MNVGIFIYDEAEVLDFSGPFEVFSTASRMCPSTTPFHVFLIGETGKTVKARGGYSVNPAFGFGEHPHIDVLIIVGGVHKRELSKPQVIAWIAENGRKADLVASVCTGVFLLAEAKIVTTQRVVTHREDIADLRLQFPALTVVDSCRWVDEDTIVTSGGISAGIDMSLHLVSKLHSMELAEKTAQQMEFFWSKN